VTDEWLKLLGESVHPDHLEDFELWIWNCKHVTDAGLGHLLKGLSGCKRLHTLKLYMGETHLSEHRSKDMINKFLKSKKSLKEVRVVSNHLDIGCPKEWHGMLGKGFVHRK
jgi:hypothetical protein